MHLGIQIAQDITQVEMTSFVEEIPEDLKDPQNWRLRRNLKDRVWIIETKMGNKYILREQKSSFHFDHVEGTGFNYSQDSENEASLAKQYPEIVTEDYVVQAEKPIIACTLPYSSDPKAGDEYLKFAIYEFEEGIQSSFPPEQIEYLDNPTDNEMLRKYEQYRQKCEEFLIESLELSDYSKLKAVMLEELFRVHVGLGIIMKGDLLGSILSKDDLVNSDADGYSLAINPEGKIQVTVFDFERVFQNPTVREEHENLADNFRGFRRIIKSATEDNTLTGGSRLTNKKAESIRQESDLETKANVFMQGLPTALSDEVMELFVQEKKYENTVKPDDFKLYQRFELESFRAMKPSLIDFLRTNYKDTVEEMIDGFVSGYEEIVIQLESIDYGEDDNLSSSEILLLIMYFLQSEDGRQILRILQMHV
ncbi:MAG: hypothetical protein Q9M91_05265 [Candidatus Dojkabacteria bacterium]|nr:hypothetical protein [Candidatus Dojkabacteria bacterium]MDQ7021214.1 hypothetical protein [Candidatus Dojkabacteria bacterium]